MTSNDSYPVSLPTYLRHPYDFYFVKILGSLDPPTYPKIGRH